MKRYRRHSLEVTADRLRDAHEKYHHLLEGRELDDISHIIFAFEEIVEGDRS